LLEDVTRSISENYGVLMDGAGHTARGLFIISDKGIIRHISINDPPVGRNVDEVVRLVEAFKTTDVTGAVCPAGWNKGKATMKADPVGSLEFFSKLE